MSQFLRRTSKKALLAQTTTLPLWSSSSTRDKTPTINCNSIDPGLPKATEATMGLEPLSRLSSPTTTSFKLHKEVEC